MGNKLNKLFVIGEFNALPIINKKEYIELSTSKTDKLLKLEVDCFIG
jgi:hypothetical protein